MCITESLRTCNFQKCRSFMGFICTSLVCPPVHYGNCLMDLLSAFGNKHMIKLMTLNRESMKKVMYFFVVVGEDNHAVTQVVDPELGF